MKSFLIVFFALLLHQIVWAQLPHFSRREIEQQKIAYLKEKLVLTDAQQELFWPLYLQWHAKESSIHKGKMQGLIRICASDEIGKMTNEQINKAIDDEIAVRLRIVQLERYYLTKIRAVIPPKKVVEMIRLQESFKRELLRKYRNLKQNHPTQR